MDGPRRSLSVISVVLALAACQPTPSLTPAPPSSTPAPTRTGAPEPNQTAAPSATVAPSAPEVSIVLPAGFDSIPWGDLPGSTGDEDSFTVSIGVLGRPATTTRTLSGQPNVSADGPAVLVEVNGSTEIIDAASGRTVATFERAELELGNVPDNNLGYYYAGHRFETDVAHGFLYFLSANRDGMQLRRFNLDGSGETVLATVAPDPGRRFWLSDFTVTPNGAVVAVACPGDTDQDTNFRCRFFEIAPGATGQFKPRYLPLRSPRPCLLLAADDTRVIAISDRFCRADGGPPQTFSYMSLNRSTLKATEIHAPSGVEPFGIAEDELGGGLVGNLGIGYPYPRAYPAMGIVLRFNDPTFSLDRYLPDDEDVDPLDADYPAYEWQIEGRGSGWTVLRGFSPDYAACRLAGLAEDPNPSCPSGPMVLQTTEGWFELPPGTWGNALPEPQVPAY